MRPRTLYAQEGWRVAAIYRAAAAMMERDGYEKVSCTHDAIVKASSYAYPGTKSLRGSNASRAHINRVLPAMAFTDFFGEWINDDEGILMLCFAACAAETGDLV